MPNEIDKAINDAMLHVNEIFEHLQLTPDEKKFVNESARKISEVAFDLLVAVPEQTRVQMRGIVMAAAIAHMIGPKYVWDRGVWNE